MSGLGWGIWGGGEIARDFARGLAEARGARLVHVAARRLDQARSLAGSEVRASSTWAELLADDAVEVVYVATPHPFHEEAALAAIESGRAVLIEKPLAPSAASTARILDAAQERGVVALEGYMYRCHPLLLELRACLRDGQIGQLRHVRADFGFHAPRNPRHRLFDPAVAGGAIWDIGGYPVTLAQWLAGLGQDEPFLAASSARFSGTVGPSGVDEWASAELGFPGGLTAQLTCSIQHDVGTRVTLWGSEGVIELPNPWLPEGQRHGLVSSFILRRRGQTAQEHLVPGRDVYALEAEHFGRALQLGRAPEPMVSAEESRAVARTLETWRAALGP